MTRFLMLLSLTILFVGFAGSAAMAGPPEVNFGCQTEVACRLSSLPIVIKSTERMVANLETSLPIEAELVESASARYAKDPTPDNQARLDSVTKMYNKRESLSRKYKEQLAADLREYDRLLALYTAMKK